MVFHITLERLVVQTGPLQGSDQCRHHIYSSPISRVVTVSSWCSPNCYDVRPGHAMSSKSLNKSLLGLPTNISSSLHSRQLPQSSMRPWGHDKPVGSSQNTSRNRHYGPMQVQFDSVSTSWFNLLCQSLSSRHDVRPVQRPLRSSCPLCPSVRWSSVLRCRCWSCWHCLGRKKGPEMTRDDLWPVNPDFLQMSRGRKRSNQQTEEHPCS